MKFSFFNGPRILFAVVCILVLSCATKKENKNLKDELNLLKTQPKEESEKEKKPTSVVGKIKNKLDIKAYLLTASDITDARYSLASGCPGSRYQVLRCSTDKLGY